MRSAPRALGRWRNTCFKAAEIDVVAADVDLLVVGMSEHDVASGATGGASQIDAALHGTLGRLREGGIFNGTFGETLSLTRPPSPIAAQAVMLIGMGRDLAGHPTRFAHLTHLAMRAALRMRAGRAACLLGWSDLELPPADVTGSAESMMRGALQALDDAGSESSSALEWIFDVRNGEADQTAAALRVALENWS